MESERQRLRVLELYSGIGGMHYALEASGISFEIVMAIDINTSANSIYKHNFPLTNLQSFSLEKLSLKYLENLNVDAILMSPPCQPFTRVGKKRDNEDIRTKSFLHLLQLLRQLKKKPTYLLVENVKGFEDSLTHAQLISCLHDCGYYYQQFMLTPLQFGIPNCRLRYYLTARLNGSFPCSNDNVIATDLHDYNSSSESSHLQSKTNPAGDNLSSDSLTTTSSNNEGKNTISPAVNQHCTKTTVSKHSSISTQSKEEISDEPSIKRPRQAPCDIENVARSYTVATPSDICQLTSSQNTIKSENILQLKDAGRNMRYCEEDDTKISEHSQSLSDYMEHGAEENFKQYLLRDKELRLFVVMDIVFPALKKSTCFTKRYGHYIDGAGSVVQMTTDVTAVSEASLFKSRVCEIKNRSEWGEQELQILRRLKLRYFTPREVANLLCFPPHFKFPDNTSSIQLYRVLGNSLNVHVVSKLIKLMVVP